LLYALRQARQIWTAGETQPLEGGEVVKHLKAVALAIYGQDAGGWRRVVGTTADGLLPTCGILVGMDSTSTLDNSVHRGSLA
jgi:hypothetical protein